MRTRLLVLASLASLLMVAGCKQPGVGSREPTSTAAAPRNTAQVKLDPGCPLGSNAQLGLAVTEFACKPQAHTSPQGPVGTPMP